MHPNPAFRGESADRNMAFARERGFGILTVGGADGPLVSHIPFVLNEAGNELRAHIVRSNPIWRHLRDGGDARAVIAISGPDGYISPDWYGVEDQVPTWNYVAVHLRGQLHLADEDSLRGHLETLSGSFETRLAPKPIWLTDKVSNDALARMLRMIAPVAMSVEKIDGTWKLGQNKPANAAANAADGLATSDIGQEISMLADLMRSPVE
ncbi:MAG: FMN-binding negative transcriptional regulator [Pikeienuella sp.]